MSNDEKDIFEYSLIDLIKFILNYKLLFLICSVLVPTFLAVKVWFDQKEIRGVEVSIVSEAMLPQNVIYLKERMFTTKRMNSFARKFPSSGEIKIFPDPKTTAYDIAIPFRFKISLISDLQNRKELASQFMSQVFGPEIFRNRIWTMLVEDRAEVFGSNKKSRDSILVAPSSSWFGSSVDGLIKGFEKGVIVEKRLADKLKQLNSIVVANLEWSYSEFVYKNGIIKEMISIYSVGILFSFFVAFLFSIKNELKVQL